MEKKFFFWVGNRLREINVYMQFLITFFLRSSFVNSVSDSVSGCSSEFLGKNLVNFRRNKELNALLISSQLGFSERVFLSTPIKLEAVIQQKFRMACNALWLYLNPIIILDLKDADLLEPAITSQMEVNLNLCDGAIGGS